MLTFVGLGLFDKTDISEKGLACIRQADHVFLESYTSCLMGSTVEELEEYYRKPVHRLFREDVEQHPDHLLELAGKEQVVFLCAGDPMVSTTHADLRIRAAERGIRTSIIHAASIASAVCGLTGLQNYRFGKSCSLPYPQKNWFPTTPFDVIAQNLDLRLHTIVYLDIRKDRFMTIPEAVALLEQMAQEKHVPIPTVRRCSPGRIGQCHCTGRACRKDPCRSIRPAAPYPRYTRRSCTTWNGATWRCLPVYENGRLPGPPCRSARNGSHSGPGENLPLPECRGGARDGPGIRERREDIPPVRRPAQCPCQCLVRVRLAPFRHHVRAPGDEPACRLPVSRPLRIPAAILCPET